MQKSFSTEEILKGDFVPWGLSMVDLIEVKRDKSIDTNYRSSLRSAVRGLWSGALSMPTFLISFGASVDRAFTAAWKEGMLACGIAFSEATPEERSALLQYKRAELAYVGGFAKSITDNSKANKGHLTPLLDRVDLWVNRLNYIRTQAKTRACADMKGMWELGPTEEHCKDCAGYAGKVYRFSVWRKYLAKFDALPQGRGLACQGYQCQCTIKVTTERATPGFPAKPFGPVKAGRRKSIWPAWVSASKPLGLMKVKPVPSTNGRSGLSSTKLLQ